jgi:hypothetical protein
MSRFVGITVGFVGMLAAIAAFWPDAVFGRSIVGTVRSLSGHPIGNAQVSIVRQGAPRAECLDRVWTEEDGSFQISLDLPTDRRDLMLEVSAVDHLPKCVPLATAGEEVELTQLVSIDGQVTAPFGVGVAGVQLQAVEAEAPHRTFDGRSRWDGTFSLRVAPDRTYVISGQSATGNPLMPVRDVVAGTLNCELRLRQ